MKINDLFHRKNFNLFFKEYLDSYTKKDKRVIKQAYSKYMEFLDTLPIKKRPSAPTPSIVKGFVEHLNSTCRGSGGASTYSRFKKVVFNAKVARINPGYNMHFVGCLRKGGAPLRKKSKKVGCTMEVSSHLF